MTAVNVSEAVPSFVTREEFSSFVQVLTSRVEAEEKLGDMRMSKLTETLNENMTEINAAIKVLTERTQNGFAVMNERLNNTNDRLSHVERDVIDIRKDMAAMNEDISEIQDNIKQNRQDITNIKNSLAVISGDVKLLGERLSHEVKGLSDNQRHVERTFNEKLDHVVDTLTVAVSGTEKRLEDFREDLQAEQNKSLTKLGIRVALFIGAVQVAVSIILHFWG